MQNLNHTGRTAAVIETVPEPAPPWHAEVEHLLAQAALACVEHDVDVETFMHGAWSAYVESRPGFKEHLEDLRLRYQIEELRKAGLLGSA